MNVVERPLGGQLSLHSGLILRDAFSPCFMLFRATWKAFTGCPLPTCNTAPSSGEATTAVPLPAARTAYFTAVWCTPISKRQSASYIYLCQDF